MTTIIDKNFIEFGLKMKNPNHAERMIAKKIPLDLMRIFGIKKVKLLEISSERICVEYRVDSQYVYLLKFNRTRDGKIEFSMENIGSSLSGLWNNRTFNGIHQRILDNWN